MTNLSFWQIVTTIGQSAAPVAALSRAAGPGGVPAFSISASNPYAAGGASATSDFGNLVWLGQRSSKRLGTADANVAFNKSLQSSLKAQFGANWKANLGAGGRIGSTADAALNLPWTWTDKQKQVAYSRASAATGKPVTNIVDFLDVWKTAVTFANQSWAGTQGGKNGSPLTPWDVLDLMKREGVGGTANSLARTVTSHSTSVEKLSAGSTWQVLQDAATRALGRAPTNSELKQFASKANSIAVHNPTRTTTTTRTNALGQVVSQRSSSQQGASAGDYMLAAQNQAATPEAGAYQAATTYYNAFANALNSPVSM